MLHAKQNFADDESAFQSFLLIWPVLKVNDLLKVLYIEKTL